MGRKPIDDGPKTAVFRMRLSDAERAALDRAAVRAGVTTSAWARAALLALALIPAAGSGQGGSRDS